MPRKKKPEPPTLNPSMEERVNKVVAQLEADPKKQRAYSCINVPLIPDSSTEPIHVVLAVRTEVGIVIGELRIPRERWNTQEFLDVVNNA